MANVLLKSKPNPPPPFCRWLSGYAFLFESPDESGTRQGDSRLASGQRSRRHRTPALARGCRWRPDEIAWRTRGRECSSSESVRAGRDALLIRKRWRGSGLARQSFHWFASFRLALRFASRRARSWRPCEPASFEQAPETTQRRSPIRSSRYDPGAPHARRTPRWLPLLVLLPEYVGIAAPVRNWMPARWANWRLADVWLEKGESAPAAAEWRCIAR